MKFVEPVFAQEARVLADEGKAGQLAAGEKEEQRSTGTERLFMVLSLGAAFAGWGLAWRAYRHADRDYKEPIAEAAPPVYQVLYHKWYVDELYDYLFTGRRKIDGARLGVMGLGDASSWFDTHVIDGAVNGAGWMTRLAALLSKWWDTWIIDGVVVNGLRYYNPLMRFSREAGKRVEVRYEPFDMSLAYAFVDGQWLTCTADAFLQVQGRSEREWELILDEWRAELRAHHRTRVTIDSSRLAAFLEEVLTEEALLSQQQRDLEGVSIREAIVGQSKTTSLELSHAEEMDEELDLATLPALEEYR